MLPWAKQLCHSQTRPGEGRLDRANAFHCHANTSIWRLAKSVVRSENVPKIQENISSQSDKANKTSRTSKAPALNTLLLVKAPGQYEIRTTKLGVVLITRLLGNCCTPCHCRPGRSNWKSAWVHIWCIDSYILFIVSPSICRCRNLRWFRILSCHVVGWKRIEA